MNAQIIEQIIGKREGITVEFKKAADSLPLNLFETVCAFESSNYESYPKNPHIAKFFVQLGRAEELGTGIRKIFKFSELYSGSKPRIEEGDVFIVKLPLQEKKNKKKVPDKVPDKVSDKVPDKVPDKLSSNQEKILLCMLKNPRISMTQIADEVGISKRKTLDNINKLKQLGRVARIGSPKGGSWMVVKLT